MNLQFEFLSCEEDLEKNSGTIYSRILKKKHVTTVLFPQFNSSSLLQTHLAPTISYTLASLSRFKLAISTSQTTYFHKVRPSSARYYSTSFQRMKINSPRSSKPCFVVGRRLIAQASMAKSSFLERSRIPCFCDGSLLMAQIPI